MIKPLLSSILHSFVLLVEAIPIRIVRTFILRFFLKNIGKRTLISRNVEFRSPYRISIGDFTNINKKVLLDGRGGNLEIGNCVDIAQDVYIWTLQHDYNDPYYASVGKSVQIDDYVWVATRATILPGVHIGRGAVVASCAVVTKDVPPLAIVAGVPARIVGWREDNMKYKLGYKS